MTSGRFAFILMAYTLIRVAARTNMDAVFAHYVGAMAEAEDGNDDYNDNDY